jgi:UDP-N-acetylmuramoyl-tripeptide--D-alanyl-D-alanine ligase
MAELGDRSSDEHAHIAAMAGELGVELVAVSTDLYGVPPVDGPDAAVVAVGQVGAGTAVLVKGSRVAGLERVATELLR